MIIFKTNFAFGMQKLKEAFLGEKQQMVSYLAIRNYVATNPESLTGTPYI